MEPHTTTPDTVTEPLGAARLPLGRLWLALAFVPGMYVILLGGAGLMLGLASGVCIFMWHLLASVVERTSPAFGAIKPELFALIILVILIYIMVQTAGLLLRAVRLSLERNTMFEPAVLLAMLPGTPLREFIDDLCRSMGADPPDSVLLHALPEIYAIQGKVVGLNGRARGRVLMLSAPLLGVLSRDELRAVIAHELAHFTGRDTAYSKFVVPVYRGTEAAIEAIGDLLTQGENNTMMRACLLPLVHGLRFYRSLFHSANMKLQRAREFRADWLAAQVAGREPLQRSLLRIACHSALFYEHLPQYIKQVRGPGVEIRNIYTTFQELADIASTQLAHYARELLEQETDPQHSHPSIPERIAATADLPTGLMDIQPARDLVPRIDVLEKQLTEALRPVLNRMMIVNHQPDRRVRLEDLQLA